MSREGASATAVDGVGALAGLVGKPIGASGWRTVTQADVDGFAAVTGDDQWIHVDPERAAAGPFGGPIAHGFLTLSLCSVVIAEALRVSGTSMQVNYGLDRVRFPSPVAVGAELRGSVELVSAEPIDGGVQAVLRVTIAVRDAPKPACVAELVVRYLEARADG